MFSGLNNMKAIIAVIVGLSLGCSNPNYLDNADSRNINSQTHSYMGDSILISKIKKMTLDSALLTYGRPVEEAKFIVNESLPESRVALFNFFSETEIKSGTIELKEVTWEKNTTQMITVWYKSEVASWVYLHHLIWKKGTEF
jgi:hypothetical protein